MSINDVRIDTSTYYSILGVPTNASTNEIRKSYMKLAKKLHPDKTKSEHTAELFKLVVDAHSILNNDQLRAEYDKKLILEGRFELHQHGAKQKNKDIRKGYTFKRNSKPYEQQPYGFGVQVPKGPHEESNYEANSNPHNENSSNNDTKMKSTNLHDTLSKDSEDKHGTDDASDIQPPTKSNDIANEVGSKRKSNSKDIHQDHSSNIGLNPLKKKKLEKKAVHATTTESRRYMRKKSEKKATPPIQPLADLQINDDWEKLREVLQRIEKEDSRGGKEFTLDIDVNEQMYNLSMESSDDEHTIPTKKRAKVGSNIQGNSRYFTQTAAYDMNQINANLGTRNTEDDRQASSKISITEIDDILDLLKERVPSPPKLGHLGVQRDQQNRALEYIKYTDELKKRILYVLSNSSTTEAMQHFNRHTQSVLAHKTMELRLCEKLTEIQKCQQGVIEYFSRTALG